MPYTKYNDPWVDSPGTTTPITAAALDHIEQGIADAGGDVTTDAVWDTKGDLVVASGPDAADNLPAGANDTVLVAASGQTLGLKYQKIVDANVDSAAAITRSKLAAKTVRLPVTLHTPAVAASAGNAFWTVAALTNFDLGHWEFVKDLDGYVYGDVLIPQALASTAGNLIVAVAASATSGVTRMKVKAAAIADGESVNSSLTTWSSVDITVPATAYLRKDQSFTMTGVDLVAGDRVTVVVQHEGSHANDTLAVNTLLLGAWLEVQVY